MDRFLTTGDASEKLAFLPPAIQWADQSGTQQDQAGIPAELFYMDIIDIEEFGAKTINALHYMGVTKVHELIRLRRRDLQKAEGIGKKARQIISWFLVTHHLTSYSDLVEANHH